MEFVRILTVSRYVVHEDRRVVSLAETHNEATYANPPEVRRIRKDWGFAHEGSPDRLVSMGELPFSATLDRLVPLEVRADVFRAQPHLTSAMLADHLGLRGLVHPDRIALAGDRRIDREAYLVVTVRANSISFFRLEARSLFGQGTRELGVYEVTVDLRTLELIEELLVQPLPDEDHDDSDTRDYVVSDGIE